MTSQSHSYHMCVMKGEIMLCNIVGVADRCFVCSNRIWERDRERGERRKSGERGDQELSRPAAIFKSIVKSTLFYLV